MNSNTIVWLTFCSIAAIGIAVPAASIVDEWVANASSKIVSSQIAKCVGARLKHDPHNVAFVCSLPGVRERFAYVKYVPREFSIPATPLSCWYALYERKGISDKLSKYDYFDCGYAIRNPT